MAFRRGFINYEGLKKVSGTLDYVANGWLPINPVLLDEINRTLAKGGYGSSQELVEDIKHDPGLLLFCLRSLRKAPQGGLELSPLSVLSRVPLEEYRTLLPEEAAEGSTLDMSLGGVSQQLQNQIVWAGAAAAARIGEELGLDGAMVFSISFFRNLGATLIAWNYPLIFSRIMAQMRRGGGDLEGRLKTSFGFTSQSLGRSAAQRWPLGASFVRSVTINESRPLPGGLGEMELTAGVVCDFGEAFARSCEPKWFPEAAASWQHFEECLGKRLGDDVIVEIKSEIESGLEDLARAKPPRKRSVVGVKPSAAPAAGQALKGALDGWQPLVQPNLAPAEEPTFLVSVEEIAAGGIDHFVREVLPEWGFPCGCVFAVDNDMLVPMLLVGEQKTSYPTVMGAGAMDDAKPLVEALQQSYPQRGFSIFRRRTPFVCGRVVCPQFTTILLLEASSELAGKLDGEVLSRFEAAQMCLAALLSEISG